LSSQIAEVGEAVRKWQDEKYLIDEKIAGVEAFQRLVLERPDEVVLEFIRDVRRQLREQQRGQS